MTVKQLLTLFDETYPNQLSDELKIRWINDVEGRVQCELCGIPAKDFRPVVDEEDPLSIPDPFTSAYLLYLTAMKELSKNYYESYAKAMKEYETALHTYGKYRIRSR